MMFSLKNCTILVAMLMTASPAFGGNSRSFFLGDEAALTGGAGVAVCADSGSLWYNPAGLGGLKLGRMELTGTVYSAKLRNLKNILKTDLGDGMNTASARADDFGSVPTSLVFVRHANDKISYGAAWYQTRDAWVDYRVDMQIPVDSEGMTWYEGFEYHQRAYVYHIGPSFGIQLHPKFRIGASLYFVYGNVNASYRFFAGAKDGDDTTPNDTMVSRSEYLSAMDLGLMITAGIQWEPAAHWHLGVVLRTPTFRVWESTDLSGLTGDASVTDTDTGIDASSVFDYTTAENTKLTFKQTVPMEAQLALAYKHDRDWIGVEAAVRPPLGEMDQKLLWNASLGGRLALTSVLSWGAGIFTDNSGDKSGENALDWKADRYGFTTGLEFRTPLHVKSTPRKKKQDDNSASTADDAAALGNAEGEKERTLTWATTLAVSYSLETAEYQSLVFDVQSNEVLTIETQHGFFHQGFVYLGTALYF